MLLIDLPINGEIKDVNTEKVESKLSGLQQMGNAIHAVSSNIPREVEPALVELVDSFGKKKIAPELLISVGLARLHNFFPTLVKNPGDEYVHERMERAKETSLTALRTIAGANYEWTMNQIGQRERARSAVSAYAARRLLVGCGFLDATYLTVGPARQVATLIATPDDMFLSMSEEDQELAASVAKYIEPNGVVEHDIISTSEMLTVQYPNRNYDCRLKKLLTI